MEKTKQLLEDIGQEIDWDNWVTKDGEHWTTTQVLYSKLEELRDVFCLTSDEAYEEFDKTVNDVQMLLTAIGEDLLEEQKNRQNENS